jgi:hypothetical protein
MTFWQFLFFFLYVRNWHTGQRELSRTRVVAFLLVLSTVVVFFTVVAFVQTPFVYEAPTVIGE